MAALDLKDMIPLAANHTSTSRVHRITVGAEFSDEYNSDAGLTTVYADGTVVGYRYDPARWTVDEARWHAEGANCDFEDARMRHPAMEKTDAIFRAMDC